MMPKTSVKRSSPLLYFFCIVLFSLFLPSHLHAQRNEVVGFIKDIDSSQALTSVAVVVAHTKDSSQKLGTFTDSTGKYVFRNLAPGNYIIIASLINYRKGFSSSFEIKASSSKIPIPDIFLAPSSKMLSGVEISAIKDKFEFLDDLLVYNVDGNSSSASITAFDLLKEVPGISVNQNDQVSIHGRSGVVFQFNGREINIASQIIIDILKGLPKSSVEAIELISDPSSQHAAKSDAGIINIKLKKEKKIGLNGSINTSGSVSNTISENVGLNLSYIDKKWTTYLNLNLGENRYKSESELSIYSPTSSGDTILQHTTDNTFSLDHSYSILLGGDCKMNEKQSFGSTLLYSLNRSPSQERNVPTSFLSSTDNFQLADSLLVEQKNMDTRRLSLEGNLFFSQKFDSTNKKLSFNLSSSFSSSQTTYDQINTYYLGPTTHFPSRFEKILQKTPVDGFSTVARVDYKHPFSKKTSLDIGVRYGFMFNDNTFHVENNTGEFIHENPEKSNQFIYQEHTWASYANVSQQFTKKIRLRLGVRAEHTSLSGNQKRHTDISTQQYAHLFPNIRLSYTFSPKNRLSLGYRKSISRPSASQLNPFEVKISDFYYRSGNAQLAPSIRHSISLFHSWNYMLSSSISYSLSEGQSDYLEDYDPVSLRRTSSPVNLKQSQTLHFSVSLRKSITPWWSVMINSSVSRQQSEAILGGQPFSYSRWSIQGFGYSNIDLPNHWGINLFGFYFPISAFGPSKASGFFSYSIGVKKSLLKDRLTFSLSTSDPFRSKITTNESNYKTHLSKSRYVSQGFSIRFSISYRFGQSSHSQETITREDDNEIDRQRSVQPASN